jgi:hypothetical protein
MGRGIEIPASKVKVPETVPRLGGLELLEVEITPHAAREADPSPIARSR